MVPPITDFKRTTERALSFSGRLRSLFIDDCTVADSDVFHARTQPTKGREFYPFSIGSVQYEVIDHGGDYVEQGQTWPTSCSTADYIIFTVALSGYCRRLHEAVDDIQIQMLAAMDAFKEVAGAVHVPIILLFTKIDVFEAMLESHCFTDFFPEYSGLMDSSSICQYLAIEFLKLNLRPKVKVYIRVVNATDAVNFKDVFEDVNSQILEPRPGSFAAPSMHQRTTWREQRWSNDVTPAALGKLENSVAGRNTSQSPIDSRILISRDSQGFFVLDSSRRTMGQENLGYLASI